jgi:hypothetical protein
MSLVSCTIVGQSLRVVPCTGTECLGRNKKLCDLMEVAERHGIRSLA